MMSYFNLLQNNIKDKSREVFVGLCVFFVAVMGTSVQHVASAAFALLLIVSFFSIRSWLTIWKQLYREERLLLIGFALYALSGVVAFINVQDVQEYIKELERYIRFLLVIPIYLFIVKYKINVIRYLYGGAIFSGPFLFYIAFSAYLNNPGIPASGHYHHIIFGSVAMLNLGVMLAFLLTEKINGFAKVVIIVSMICGFFAAILSQSRGVWLVLPFYTVIALYFSLKYSRARFIGVMMVFVLVVTVVFSTPFGDMVNKRIETAVNEVTAFYIKDQYSSSLGARLAMWEIAIDVWKQHPVIGTGPGDFDEVIRELQKNGKYIGMDVHGSTHNIYMQSLVNAGSLGFIVMIFAIILMPLKIVMQSNLGRSTRSLVGLVVVGLFSILGLGESWTLRLPSVSVYIIFMTVVISSIFQCKRSFNDFSVKEAS